MSSIKQFQSTQIFQLPLFKGVLLFLFSTPLSIPFMNFHISVDKIILWVGCIGIEK